uniref:Integrase catalytic domain-containing protein n=1 Tax=Arundo donax TaxID=35708 RepID=A0A0A8YRH5_ARUDO
MNNIFKLHGLPQAIISDRDRIFTSALWQELFRLAQTHLRLSSSYHPQTDRQTE